MYSTAGALAGSTVAAMSGTCSVRMSSIDVADDRRHGDGEKHAPGAVEPRHDGLLGDVRRGVVAGVGPLRLQQAEHERQAMPPLA